MTDIEKSALRKAWKIYNRKLLAKGLNTVNFKQFYKLVRNYGKKLK